MELVFKGQQFSIFENRYNFTAPQVLELGNQMTTSSKEEKTLY